jgi:hypothetical protein
MSLPFSNQSDCPTGNPKHAGKYPTPRMILKSSEQRFWILNGHFNFDDLVKSLKKVMASGAKQSRSL